MRTPFVSPERPALLKMPLGRDNTASPGAECDTEKANSSVVTFWVRSRYLEFVDVWGSCVVEVHRGDF
jgi:hypothetical protein